MLILSITYRGGVSYEQSDSPQNRFGAFGTNKLEGPGPYSGIKLPKKLKMGRVLIRK